MEEEAKKETAPAEPKAAPVAPAQSPKPAAPSPKAGAKEKVKPVAKPKGGFLCAILVRGLVGVRHDIRDALTSLRLLRKHVCVVLEDTPINRGQLVKAKDYITFGTITAETKKELESKRGVKDKKFFRLHPPRGGFERKGIKKHFTEGGVLGNRGDKMNDLVLRML
ncbi:hypothetical protein GOV07_00555 [Candidatus Woesearchaeota archaeon]|nr:hypothetical protein [Candidatus Woesearchaeota archaeon]